MPLPLTPQALRALYRDRWPVEQLPLVATHLLGAARQFVHAPQTCQRLPVLALLAGALLSYAAATAPARPTGFWDRRPQPTAGRPQLVGQRALTETPPPVDAGLRCTMEIAQRLRIGVLVAEDVQLGLRHCRPNAGKEVK
jgi:hypothetical protein